MAELDEVLNSLNDRLCALEGKSLAFEKLITYQMLMFLAKNEEIQAVWDEGLDASIKSFKKIMNGSDEPTTKLIGEAIETLDRCRFRDLADLPPAFPYTIINGGVKD